MISYILDNNDDVRRVSSIHPHMLYIFWRKADKGHYGILNLLPQISNKVNKNQNSHDKLQCIHYYVE
jgi:hypothetical protein